MMVVLLLPLLFGPHVAMAQRGWTQVDDPRCHDVPNNPIIPPLPYPTPFPPAPTPITVWKPPVEATSAPTPATEICTGYVKGFRVIDLDTNEPVMDLEESSTLLLSALPTKFTIEAITPPTVGDVKFYVDEKYISTDGNAPFYFRGDSLFNDLYVQGTYTLSAYGRAGRVSESLDEACSMSITVDYNNPHICEGIVQQFALFDTDKQAIVPGYEVLANNQILQLSDLPNHLTIIARTNGRGSGVAYFGYGTNSTYSEVSGGPYAITGHDKNGRVLEWPDLQNTGTFAIKARFQNKLNEPEPENLNCELTLNVVSDKMCPNLIESFTLIDATTSAPVQGYERITGNRVIDLNVVPELLTLRANKLDNGVDGVRFYLNGVFKRFEGVAPYALNGDRRGDFYADAIFEGPGTYVLEARGMLADGSFEPASDACMLTLTVEKSLVNDNVPIETIDLGHEPCAPAQVVPDQAGNHMFHTTPVVVVDVRTNHTVAFQTANYIKNTTMDWITTSFVSASGVEVCDKVSDMSYQQKGDSIYEAKCFNGFAYADVYAYSTAFSENQATADTSFLPSACKNDFEGKVVKYTFVFSCDCENIPDVPDTVTGGVTKTLPQCSGLVGSTWGDPHVSTFDNVQYRCQAAGEFVLSKAILKDYHYDFEARARFSNYKVANFKWTWTTGVVIQQDVTVQISIGEESSTSEHSNMFENLPINFYVNGEPRLLSQGSGDHRVMVSVDGFHINLFFVSTGIHVRVRVLPSTVVNHNNLNDHVPGSINAYICIPDDNENIVDVMGLLGTPNGDKQDEWMDMNGNLVPMEIDSSTQNSAKEYNYCTTHWCIRDEADSLFAYEDGYSFSHYNGCDDPEARRLEGTTATNGEEEIHHEIVDICSVLDTPDACVQDGVAMGVEAAHAAVQAILSLQQQRRSSSLAPTPDDGACCSRDFKTCDSDCAAAGTNKYTCGGDTAGVCGNINAKNESFVWLPQGTWMFETDGPLASCLAKHQVCEQTSSKQEENNNVLVCCPGLECVSEECVASATTSQTVSRRLITEGNFLRPDLPIIRNVNALSGMP